MADPGALSASVSEISFTAGTGTYTLGRSRGNYLRFRDAYTSGATIKFYHVTDDSGQMEVNRDGVFTAPDQLTRGTFLMSSTGAPISWPATGQRIVTPLATGLPLCDTPPTLHQVLAWDGTEYCPADISALPVPDDDTADMQDFDTGITFTITLTKPVTQAVCRSTMAGVKTWNIPDPALFNGYSLDIKTATNDGSTHNVVPAGNTIGGLPGITFTDTNCNLFLRAKAADNDWIIRCLCCYTPTPFAPPPSCVPYIVYSNRKAMSSYSGNLYTIQRSSDNATHAFPPTGGGDADSTAINAFIGAGNGIVTVWNDQSGNGFDAVENLIAWTTAPSWEDAQVNGHPALGFTKFRQPERGLYVSGLTFPTAKWTIYVVMKHDIYTNAATYPNITDNFGIMGINGKNDGPPDFGVYIRPEPNSPGPPTGMRTNASADDSTFSNGNGIATDNTAGVGDNYSLIEYVWDSTPSDGSVKFNNADFVSINNNSNQYGGADFAVTGDLAIGDVSVANSGVDLFVGWIAEIWVYNCIQTPTERTARRNDIASYYGITLS